MIAQEVEAVVPEVVETGPDQMKGIDYDGLVALLVEAVKDQQEHIEDFNSFGIHFDNYDSTNSEENTMLSPSTPSIHRLLRVC